MSITDELRECMKGSTLSSWMVERLTAIADRIDAEHEKAIASVMNDALYHANEKDMAELGWIRLPKDADDVPICVGDDMESVNAAHMHGPVEYIALTESGWEVDGEPPSSMRHHRPDTWERIIEDALDGYHDTDFDALVARCRALASEPTP